MRVWLSQSAAGALNEVCRIPLGEGEVGTVRAAMQALGEHVDSQRRSMLAETRAIRREVLGPLQRGQSVTSEGFSSIMSDAHSVLETVQQGEDAVAMAEGRVAQARESLNAAVAYRESATHDPRATTLETQWRVELAAAETAEASARSHAGVARAEHRTRMADVAMRLQEQDALRTTNADGTVRRLLALFKQQVAEEAQRIARLEEVASIVDRKLDRRLVIATSTSATKLLRARERSRTGDSADSHDGASPVGRPSSESGDAGAGDGSGLTPVAEAAEEGPTGASGVEGVVIRSPAELARTASAVTGTAASQGHVGAERRHSDPPHAASPRVASSARRRTPPPPPRPPAHRGPARARRQTAPPGSIGSFFGGIVDSVSKAFSVEAAPAKPYARRREPTRLPNDASDDSLGISPYHDEESHDEALEGVMRARISQWFVARADAPTPGDAAAPDAKGDDAEAAAAPDADGAGNEELADGALDGDVGRDGGGSAAGKDSAFHAAEPSTDPGAAPPGRPDGIVASAGAADAGSDAWFARVFRSRQGRSSFVRVLNEMRASHELKWGLDELSKLMRSLLDEAAAGDDLANIASVMLMAETFCQVVEPPETASGTDGTAAAAAVDASPTRTAPVVQSAQELIRDHAVFQSLEMWQDLLFHDLEKQFSDMSHTPALRGMVRRMSMGSRGDTERNTVFGHIGSFSVSMGSFGVPADERRRFVLRMAAVYGLPSDQTEMLLGSIPPLAVGSGVGHG